MSTTAQAVAPKDSREERSAGTIEPMGESVELLTEALAEIVFAAWTESRRREKRATA